MRKYPFTARNIYTPVDPQLTEALKVVTKPPKGH